MEFIKQSSPASDNTAKIDIITGPSEEQVYWSQGSGLPYKGEMKPFPAMFYSKGEDGGAQPIGVMPVTCEKDSKGLLCITGEAKVIPRKSTEEAIAQAAIVLYDPEERTGMLHFTPDKQE